MTDFGKRGKFFQRTTSEAHFLSLAKKIREEIFQESKTLFLDPDLSHRSRAFLDLKNLKSKYANILKSIDLEQRNKLFHAIDLDNHKIENALQFAHVIPYLDLEIGHIPLLDANTGKPFTLFEYLKDPSYLSNRMITFEIHLPKFSTKKLESWLPGIHDKALLDELQSGKSNPHLLFEADDIQYDIQKRGQSVHIKGRCLLKNCTHLIKFEVPPSENPGDINWEMDRILKEKRA